VNPKDLQDIIDRCVHGKRDAQSALYDQYAGKMYALCLYYSKNGEEAKDLLHNGFIKVFQKIGQYKGKAPFEAWMRRVFTNTALELFRKQKFTEEIDQYQDQLESFNVDAINKISETELIELIQSLSPAYKMVFILYAIEGYSHKEIAEKMKISVGTSKSNLARARQKLQTAIRERYPEIYNER